MERLSDAGHLALVHQALVNRRHGIITTLLEETEHPDARGLFVFNALMVDIKSMMIDPARGKANNPNSDRASLAGSGAAFDRTSAMWAAFGEAVERYAAAAHFDDQVLYASQDALGEAAVGPGQFVLFTPEQYVEGFEFAPDDRSVVRAWAPAADLMDPERETYVPAQMVYLGMQVKDKREIVMQSSSTGLATGMDEGRALLSGLSEVIERDAFAAMWQMQYAPRKLVVAPATMERLLSGVRRQLAHPSLDVHLWDISTDVGMPVVLCLARSRNDGTMSLGASAHVDVATAINKAVVEAFHGYCWGSSILSAGNPLPERAAIRNPGDHFAYFLERERQGAMDFLFTNEATISSDHPSLHQLANMDDLLARLKSMGLRALAVDVTSGDVASLGFCVLRAFVPGLHPLLFGDGMLTRDERRLRVIAAHWGLPGVPEPNPDPHPFP
ncbi:YcaO-like family protein [Pseudoduganella violaceinigra]|uniref:YcaO-like family protein n=1 Tax=Pseudoduganella violaceinigra TaxID=246602 RepID=UPI0003F97C3B|nr:YcaO-like family protein [Pseudoduganella violaceinigra]